MKTTNTVLNPEEVKTVSDYQRRTSGSNLTQCSCPNIIVNNGGIFDLQSALGKMPGFIWSKYPNEKHFYKFPFGAYSYLGPSTALNIRLDENDNPKPGEEPVSPTDELALHHDIAYRNAEKLDSENALQMKHEADKIMIEKLDQVATTSIIDKFANFTAKKLLQLKLKFGMSLRSPEEVKTMSDVQRSFSNPVIDELTKLSSITAEQISNQLHKPIQHKFYRRKVIVYNLDEIWACDLMDFSKDPIYYKRFRYNYVLVIIDCFSKFCWCFMIKQKTPEEIINCYETLFKTVKPEYLWWDMEKAIDSKKFSDFLKDQGIKLYHTYSEPKVSIAERMIRTLKEKCEKVKTQYTLEGKEFKLYEVLPQVLEEYNFNTIHRTIEMIPADGRKLENQMKLKNKYSEIYNKYNPENKSLLSVGDHVRISAYKGIFDKGYKKNWTIEIFTIGKVQDTKPITYLLKDKNNKEIKGCFYSQELQKVNFITN